MTLNVPLMMTSTRNGKAGFNSAGAGAKGEMAISISEMSCGWDAIGGV